MRPACLIRVHSQFFRDAVRQQREDGQQECFSGSVQPATVSPTTDEMKVLPGLAGFKLELIRLSSVVSDYLKETHGAHRARPWRPFGHRDHYIG